MASCCPGTLGGSGGSGRSSFGGKGGSSLSFGGSWGRGCLPLMVEVVAPPSGSFGGRGGMGLPFGSCTLVLLCGSCGRASLRMLCELSFDDGSGGSDRVKTSTSSSLGGRGGSARLLTGTLLSVGGSCGGVFSSVVSK